MKNGWQTKALGEICLVDWGNTDLTKSAYVEGGRFLAVSAAGCDGRIGHREHAKHTPVLSAIGAQCGRMFLPEEDFTAIKNTITLTPREGTCTGKFLYQLLTHIELPKRGSAQPFISKGDIQIFQVPVPPLSEQNRIVSILEQTFASVTSAKANAEKNLLNAHALFESHLESIFARRRERWREQRLGDVVTRLTNGYVGPTRGIYQNSGVPYLLARHVKNNRLLFDGRTFITDEFNRQNKKSVLKAGDVLLVQSGHIGHSAAVTEEHHGHNCHAMIVITPVEGSFIGPFLSLFFNSSGMKQKFQEIRSGSTVPHLTCGEVRELMVALPDLATQKRLVDHSQELEVETQHLESLYQQKLAALEALKKSLLHQAFTGAL
jgi:type I restriction enzyme S subunit